MKLPTIFISCIATAFVVADANFAAAQNGPFASIKELDVPAIEGSRGPNLFASKDGHVLLTWTEPVEKSFAVRRAIGDENGWSDARTVTEGDDLFVNWANFPSAIALPDGALAAYWLKINGDSNDYVSFA